MRHLAGRMVSEPAKRYCEAQGPGAAGEETLGVGLGISVDVPGN